MKRYDPIQYNDFGSWDWDSSCIKEDSEAGEYVRLDDVKAAFKTIEGRINAIIKEAYDDCDDGEAHVYEIAAIYIKALKEEMEI